MGGHTLRHRRWAAWAALVALLTVTAAPGMGSGAGLRRTERTAESAAPAPAPVTPAAAQLKPEAPAQPPALASAPGRTVIGGPSALRPEAERPAEAPRMVTGPTPADGQQAALPAGLRHGVATRVVLSPDPGPAPAVAPSATVDERPPVAPVPQADAVTLPLAQAEPPPRTVVVPGPAPGAMPPAPPAALTEPAGPPPMTAPQPVTGQGLAVTPERAAVLAVQNSLDLEITAADIREAEAQVARALGLSDFRVTVSAMLGKRGPVSTFTLPGEEGEDPTEVSLGSGDIRTAQLQVVKPLYTEGRIELAQQVARRALETRKLSKAVVERALDLAARQTAYTVLRAEQMLDVTQQRALAVAAHLDQTRKLMDAGVVARFEVVQAETELARAQGDVIAARTGVESGRAVLRRVLTLSQDTPLEVVPGAAHEAPEGTLQELIERAREQRPEVHTARAAVALAEANLRLAGTSRNLSVSLVGGMTRSQASFGAEPLGWQVAISAEKSLLDGRVERSEVRAAEANLDSARLSLEKTRQEVALDVTQSYLQLDEARERLTVARQGVVEAQERLRIAQVRYESGVGLGIEVLDAQTALAASRADVVNAHYSLQLAVAQLRSALGLWSGNE